jgi:thioesterase domain-containing protein
VKHYLPVIELTIDAANIPGLVPSYTVALAYRQQDHDHDVLVIVYLPNFAPDDYQSHIDTHNAITKTVLDFGVKPHKIVPLPPHLLEKSTLGKLPKNKIREAFQHGVYGQYEQSQEGILRDHHESNHEPAQTPTEQAIIDTYHALFPTLTSQIGRHTDLFTIGVSSMDVLKMQYILQKRLSIPDTPLTTFFTHSILHKLAVALDGLKKHHEYNPVVVLQPHGEKTPLWLIHPGVGEVLIFMPLAQHLTSRPVYALRSRGFDGEVFFTSMAENVSVFHAAIKRQQPHGPYALAGYSFGSILGFEIAKKMESEGDEVKFLATFDQPPFFKARALSYDWHETILWISAFLGLIPESSVRPSLPSYRLLSRPQTITKLLSSAPAGRVEEVNMTAEKLENWANLALQLKRNSAEWDPEGMVGTMDVFYTEPLRGLVKADTIEEWYEGFMSKWMGFVEKQGLLFWPVAGTHRTMINEGNLEGFLEVFEKAMEHRGI